MSRGGHNWKGAGTVEGCRSLDVMKLARAGYLSGRWSGGWQWTYGDGSRAWIQIMGGRDAVTLDYRFKADDKEWHPVNQRVPIRWTPCRFGGERRGSSARFEQTARIADDRLPHSTVPAGYSPADIATASVTQCSAADPWTPLIIACDVCIVSWGPITMVRTVSHRPSQSGCDGGRTLSSHCKLGLARNIWIRSSPSGQCEYLPGSRGRNSTEGRDDEHYAGSC